MRWFLIPAMLLGACGKDPLRDDMKMFCRSVDIWTFDHKVPKTGPGHITLREIGPWIEERAKTPELQNLLAQFKNDTISEPDFLTKIEELNKQANIDSCPTLSWDRKPKDL